ncbi:MAG TPA: VOC family protein [Kofleriaceae bacterium]|jgi:glyoxylase I family protein
MLHIKLTSVMVTDQAKALAFYTDILGFATAMDFPAGEYRWITVAAKDRADLQLALEPNANPAGRAFQEAMFAQGIPIASFESTDLDADYARLSAAGVAFTKPPTSLGAVKVAVFADTVGNLIQLHQPLIAQ